MATVTKVGAVTFTHNEEFKGEIEIERGGLAITVPFEALQKVVAEKVRMKLIEDIAMLKPHEVLALAATKK